MRRVRERTREVPGDDLTYDTDRLVHGVDELFAVGLDGLTMDLVGPTSIVSDGGDGEGDICVPSPLERLACTESSDVSNWFG